MITKYKVELSVFSLSAVLFLFAFSNLKEPSNIEANKPTENTLTAKSHNKRLPAGNKSSTLKDVVDSKVTLKGLQKFEDCLQSATCAYPDSDPREYNLSVYKDLSFYIKTQKQQWVSDWSLMANSQRTQIASLLKHNDGFVKAEVLDLLSTLPKAEASKHLDLVLNEVVDFYDSELIPSAILFLNKVKTSENEVGIAGRLTNAVLHGGPHVSQEISKNISTLLNKQTSEVFKTALSTLPRTAPETTHLSAAIDEFELKASGG